MISLEQIEILRMKREDREMTDKTFDTLPPILYDTNLAAIAKLKEAYMPLEITDLEDKEQFEAVHDARMVMVKVRTRIDKQRKSNNDGARKYIKDNDDAAKELLAESTPIEEHLQAEEQKVTDEEKQIKAEEAEKFRVMIQERVDALQEYNVVLPFADVAGMEDGVFEFKLETAKLNYEAEQKRIADEEQERIDRQVEIDRKAAEQAEKDKEQADKEEALRIEREAFEAEKREAKEKKDRKEFEAKAKEDARIQAEKDAAKVIEDARIAAEAAETARILKEAVEKAEADRRATLLPDKEKLIAWAECIASTVEPEVHSAEAKEIVENAGMALSQICEHIIRKAEGM